MAPRQGLKVSAFVFKLHFKLTEKWVLGRHKLFRSGTSNGKSSARKHFISLVVVKNAVQHAVQFFLGGLRSKVEANLQMQYTDHYLARNLGTGTMKNA